MLKRLMQVDLLLNNVSEQFAWMPMVSCRAAEITPKLDAATKTAPNVYLADYAIRLELSPKEQQSGD